jgi:hypothetical protein
LIQSDISTPIADQWRMLLEFRSHVFCDGLWHAYGDGIVEQGFEEEFRAALQNLDFEDVQQMIYEMASSTTDEDVTEALNDHRLARVVEANPDSFTFLDPQASHRCAKKRLEAGRH